MLWSYCLSCFATGQLRRQGPHLYLCDTCLDELDELTVRPSVRSVGMPELVDITMLYRYQGVVRRLILRAKVKSDHRALLLLTTLACQHPASNALSAWCDSVMPSPSSLWGRLRGRLDIASQISHRLSQAAKPAKPIVPAPLHLHWRMQKQAQLMRSARQPAKLPPWLIGLGKTRCTRHLQRRGTQRLLLIDDVMTTGGTLKQTAADTYQGDWVQRGLVLASP